MTSWSRVPEWKPPEKGGRTVSPVSTRRVGETNLGSSLPSLSLFRTPKTCQVHFTFGTPQSGEVDQGSRPRREGSSRF